MHYTTTIIVPAIPPSLNRFAGRQNVHEYRDLKKRWTTWVALLCREKPPEPLSRAVVEITYFFPTDRRRDPDNYAGKLLLDGLTAGGIIKDDSFNCIELVLRGSKAKLKRNIRTEITVTEVL